jgi:hypothetical protein
MLNGNKAKTKMFDFIEMFYTQKKRQSLRQVSPAKFEETYFGTTHCLEKTGKLMPSEITQKQYILKFKWAIQLLKLVH